MSTHTNRRDSRGSPRERMGAALLSALIALTASACATGGGTPDTAASTRTPISISSTTGRETVDIRTEASLQKITVPVPPTQAWSVLESVYEELGVPVETRDPRSRLMGNEGFLARRVEGRPMSRYIDCGSGFSGPLADTYDVTLTLLTQLRDLDGQGTEVTVFLDAFARARATSSNSIHCTSKQSLERRVGELIREKIVG